MRFLRCGIFLLSIVWLWSTFSCEVVVDFDGSTAAEMDRIWFEMDALSFSSPYQLVLSRYFVANDHFRQPMVSSGQVLHTEIPEQRREFTNFSYPLNICNYRFACVARLTWIGDCQWWTKSATRPWNVREERRTTENRILHWTNCRLNCWETQNDGSALRLARSYSTVARCQSRRNPSSSHRQWSEEHTRIEFNSVSHRVAYEERLWFNARRFWAKLLDSCKRRSLANKCAIRVRSNGLPWLSITLVAFSSASRLNF